MPQPMYIPTENTTSFEQKRICTRLGTLFWLLAVVLGALHAWAWRDYMDSDSIVYADIGDAYFRHDWHNAINAQWNPLYSWVLGAANHAFKPSMSWEFPLAHAVDFTCYIVALICFEFLISQILRHRRMIGDVTEQDWPYLLVGYPVFIWGCGILIPRFYVGPDVLVAAVLFLVVGLFLRIRAGKAGWRSFAGLGVALGCGYLLKPVMFPIAFLLLLFGFLAVGNPRRAAPRVLLALAVFLIIGAPFIAAISKAKGRLTYGDSGKLNYVFDINDLNLHTDCTWCNYHVHWQGDVPGGGVAKHPTRKLLDKPALYEFATPIAGTYPPWYDPSYWYEGATPHFELKPHLRRLARNSVIYLELFLSRVGAVLIAGLLVLMFCAGREWRFLVGRMAAGYWVLIVPALAGLAIYWPLHVETRFIGGHMILLWAGLFALPLAGDVGIPSRLKSSVALAVMATMLIGIGWEALQPPAWNALHDLIRGEDPTAHMQWQIATGLRKMGINPGDHVALMNLLGFDETWARLDRVKIVAEMPSSREFWNGDQALRDKVIRTFAGTGAKVIVTTKPPAYPAGDKGWVQIGKTTRYAYFLR